MELFDIIKNIFSQKEEIWKSISSNDKNRNFFMINRIMSIQFPIQANEFNKLRINPIYVVDWWHDTLKHRFYKSPPWVFTKTKKSNLVRITDNNNETETENFLREKFFLSKRQLSELKFFYPDRYQKWILDLTEQIGTQKKISNEKA